MVGLPFFGGRRRAGRQPDDRVKEVERLQKEVEQLRAANEQLREQLSARNVHLGEYLYKWKTVALPLLGSEWELRYWVLSGTSLAYFRSARDTAFSPREEISVMGCFVSWEGLRSGRYWSFSVLDGGGSLLVRLAALSREAAERWVAALEAAGCSRDDSLVPPAGPKGSREAAKSGMRDLARSLSAPSPLPPPPPGRAAAAAAAAAATMPGDAAAAAQQAGTRGKNKKRTPSQLSQGSGAADSASDSGSAAGSGSRAARQRAPSGPLSAAAAGGAPDTVTAAAPAPFAAAVTVSASAAAASSAAATAASIPAPPTPAPLHPRRSLGARPGGGGPERGPMFGSTPVHTSCRFSLLSSERAWHEKHTGLYNLALIILVLTNFRLALENALKYGWRLNPVRLAADLLAGRGGPGSGPGAGLVNVPLVCCYPCLLAAALLSLGAERAGHALLQQELRLRESLSKRRDMSEAAAAAALASRARAHEWLLFLLNTATTCTVIGLPWAVISLTRAEPVSGGILITLSVVLWMKLVSYHHCCFDLRMARRGGEVRPGERGCPDTPAEDWGPLERYPENLTLRNLLYFLAVPTLTYQVNYPRARSIRGRWLLRRCFELAITLTALAILVGQYIQPAVSNSMAPLRQMDMPRVAERVLKLALPSTYAWLLGFYGLFHLWLNVLAELTRFGDREFYKDWWNAATVGEYWKLWNMPVHKWLLRHVYFPAIRAGTPRFPAIVLTFFVSAVFHELLLGVPLHLVRFWAFCGIMFQVPLILVTEKLQKRLNRAELGNYIFWIAFCVVGQPVSVLLYYHDYMVGIRPSMLALRGAAAAAAGGVPDLGLGGLGSPLLGNATAAAVVNGTLGAGAGSLTG